MFLQERLLKQLGPGRREGRPVIQMPRLPGRVQNRLAGRKGLGQLVPFLGVQAKAERLGVVFLGLQQGLQQNRAEQVVLIHQNHIRGIGCVHASVPGTAHTAVGLVDDPKPEIFGRPFIADAGRRVGAAVIHQDRLPVGKTLGPDALKTAGQILGHIVNGNHDGNGCHKKLL